MGQVCEPQFFDLDPTFEPTLTPERLLDFHQFPKSVLVSIPYEPKSIIFHNHTQLLDKGVEQNDLEMIFQN